MTYLWPYVNYYFEPVNKVINMRVHKDQYQSVVRQTHYKLQNKH